MARARGPVKVTPLWLRVERNRLKLAVFMLAFLLAWALAFIIVLWAPGVLVLAAVSAYGSANADPGFWLQLSRWVLADLPASAVGVGILGAVCSIVYAAVMLAQPLRRRLAALGVRAVYREYPETRRALRDMAIASGYAELQPELFVLESASLNAFIIGKAHERAYVVITSRMAERVSIDHQRAIFANLMARLRAGDVQWATAVSALMSPVWRWKDLGLAPDERIVLDRERRIYVAGDPAGPTYSAVRERRPAEESPATDASYIAMFPFVGPFVWLTYTAAVIASELVAFGHRRSHLIASELADAEGMLLLKDPRPMLGALREAIEADNRIRVAQPLYAQLFYIWAGDDLTDEDDPEWQRLDRLQEIVGTDGLADAASDTLSPAEQHPDLAVPPSPVSELSREPGYIPPPKRDYVEIPDQVFVWGPLLGGLIVSMAATGGLMSMGATRPVMADPGDPVLAEYAARFASLEVAAVAVVLVTAFVAAVMSGRKGIGTLVGVVCAVTMLGIDLLGRSLMTTVDLGMNGELLLVLVGGGAVLTGLAGGAVGSLVRRG